jgi:hypothetical protein
MVSSDLVLNLATLFAPVVLVYVVNSFHPAFVFLYGFVFATTAAHLLQGIPRSRKHVIQRLVMVMCMLAGALLLYA